MLTDDQLDVLRTVERAGGSFTATTMEPSELRRLVSVGRVLGRRGLLRLIHTDAAAFVELTEAGQFQIQLASR